LKVVQVLPDLNGGGVEKGTLEVAGFLASQGHESIVISAGGTMVKELEDQGSRHIIWNLGKKSPFTFRHVFAVRRWLQEEAPDVVHVRSRMPAWVIWLAWRKLPEDKRPHLVSTVHGLYSVSRYSAIMTRGERVIAVSETIKAYIEKNYPKTDMDRVRLVYRGIEPEDFPYGFEASADWLGQWEREFPQLKNKQVITLPGRLTRLKGHHHLIDLIASFKKQGVPVHGLIVGGEDPKRRQYATELRERILREGLVDDITFTGARRDIREIYSISNLVLSLSTKPESFGRTTLEALSMGVPVVGYDHGGVGEILQALFPEGLVPLNDQQVLKTTLENILQAQSKPRPNDRFFRSEMLAQTLGIYQELVA
jgi:glycosyltransferase involved in cell wall biosynthesis